MFRSRTVRTCLFAATIVWSLTACSKGGKLSLEPGAIPVTESPVNKGAPSVTVNQGGKALLVQQGHTASNGVHGYASIQTVKAKKISGGGRYGIINTPQAHSNLFRE